MLTVVAIRFEDRLCTSKKDGIGGWANSYIVFGGQNNFVLRLSSHPNEKDENLVLIRT